MNIVRRGIAILSAFPLAMVAMVAIAGGGGGGDDDDKKLFTLAAPSSVSVSTTTIAVTFTNVASSSFNALSITGTVGGGGSLTITNAVGSPGGPGTKQGGTTNSFKLTNLSPVKSNNSITVTMTVQITGTACSGGTITWKGAAWTGSVSSPSTAFTQKNANPVTTLNAVCNYSITGSVPSSITKGTSQSLDVTVTNAAGSSSPITSVSLTPPAGITTPTTSYAVNIAPGTSGVINVSATAGCGSPGSGGAWGSSVTGFTKSGGDPSTSVSGVCAVRFSNPPKSAVSGESLPLTVQSVDGAGAVIPGFAGGVTLVSTTPACTIVGVNPVNAIDGSASFHVSLTIAAMTPTCTLKATTTIDGKGFETPLLPLTVFADVLDQCSTTPFDALHLPASGETPGQFDGSAGGATTVGQAGFASGIRGNGDAKGSDTCTPTNFSVTNNIPPAGTTDATDPLGNQVPPGSFSFTFDNGAVLNPVVSIISTYRSEWGDAATGLPTRQTKVCTVVPCPGGPDDFPAAWKVIPACLDSLVQHASIPAGEAACLVSESWRVVPAGDPQYCAPPPPAAPPAPPPGWAPRCLQATTITIFGQDPVVGRGGGGGV